MPFNIYPYNFYILYGAIGLVVLFLILLLIKVIGLGKAVGAYAPQLNRLSARVEYTSIKAAAIQEKQAEDAKKNKWMKLAMPILLAVYEVYKSDPELTGIMGYKDAVLRYVKQQKDDRKLADRLRKLL